MQRPLQLRLDKRRETTVCPNQQPAGTRGDNRSSAMCHTVDDCFSTLFGRNRKSFALNYASGRALTGGMRLKIGIHVAGKDSHYMDAVAPEFGTLGGGNARQSELAGGIDGEPGQAALGRDGSDVHQGAAGLPQPGQGELGEREWREEIKIEDGAGFVERS